MYNAQSAHILIFYFLLEWEIHILSLMCALQPVLRIRIRDPVPFWPLDPDPGSGIGSRIPNPSFWELSDKLLSKKCYISLKTGPTFFRQYIKNKIILNFVKFVATKKVWQQIFFPHLSFVAVFGSWIRDKHPGSATLPATVKKHVFTF